MKIDVGRCCEVEVKCDEKYLPFVKEAVNEFLKYVDCYYALGFIESIKVGVSFKPKEKK